MAKYPHNTDVKIVLADLENRVQQLIEANSLAREKMPELVANQELAFQAVLTIIRQVKDNGHVFRGNDYFPDSLEPLVKTKWNKQVQLGVK